MVPWLAAAAPKAESSASTSRWLVSTFPPTTAGQRAGSAGKGGLRNPSGRTTSTRRSSPSLRGSGRSTSRRTA